jgi:hypothetical protein
VLGREEILKRRDFMEDVSFDGNMVFKIEFDDCTRFVRPMAGSNGHSLLI